MSSESEKDKERLFQAAKTFFFQIQDLASSTNTLTELFNSSMDAQIILMAVKEDGHVKDVFEQMLNIFKEMQSAVDAKQEKMQKEPLCSKIAAAVCSVVEKSTTVKELQQSAKEMFKNVPIPIMVSALSGSSILGNLESSLSFLMKYPIMNLRLSDFYRKDTKPQSDASTSEKSPSSGLPKTTTVDTLKKVQDALKTENAENTIELAADQLEKIVSAMGPILEILQKAIKTMEGKISVSKKADN
ncbi:uncharacterized protein C12orf60 homolog [Equus asinus]|uniref:Chromosome 6 C12orf60 homolog n=3 Tax=Equus TaxID=9789 RepID=F6WWE9_HORSE|nr:uncharacterized protein C12orf60 homolog [Equus caballus]XP_005611013.1 uncharacterized protein C12orf60 homolog [Equus caballus]XP_008539762.1 PREDICTED: uncharacterized protein C12orf60 homolog [Equus przewalskii]XP_008539763.1 PREDICTED: uncharacterized protein C12orf60 homolog [Equus przewalskii]XP_008539764.1 PREDICTED: uncharacterized protein C12orf60 homolog [Equus przewalskii]XP_008539765.1 PREDICTED: uncharacterized protein C12orf60 homolog [Equus przewalskii]XP_008539766.1 PREDIC